ncbi:hypothetical protein LP420_23525 [Massilia sp. B-10]|nr:hypothetical protein LP420_23525 [Massilia sp. B-10]
MTLNWVVYAIALSVLLCAAALARHERAARLWQLSTRWMWAAAMAASLLLPLAAVTLPVAPPLQDTGAPQQRTAPPLATPVGKAASQWVAAKTAPSRGAGGYLAQARMDGAVGDHAARADRQRRHAGQAQAWLADHAHRRHRRLRGAGCRTGRDRLAPPPHRAAAVAHAVASAAAGAGHGA